MRISKQHRKILKELSSRHFGTNSQIYLFGSRTDDSRRGGDLDLYVSDYALSDSQQLKAKIDFLVEAKRLLGDQRIDLVFAPLPGQKELPIHQQAKATGICL
ncbi:MAG: nucleotidyltransferase domain-containing protein [Magnetococcales bacterium]|nr:nucleotidyltransferase domain-containing protein [Magnetococcales bacterium]NGZ25271.1 nucleotidyltransferase domain-containing protein [Magnetococcales bacterium]